MFVGDFNVNTSLHIGTHNCLTIPCVVNGQYPVTISLGTNQCFLNILVNVFNQTTTVYTMCSNATTNMFRKGKSLLDACISPLDYPDSPFNEFHMLSSGYGVNFH